MNKQKRYLITTADEKTWKFDRPVIFFINIPQITSNYYLYVLYYMQSLFFFVLDLKMLVTRIIGKTLLSLIVVGGVLTVCKRLKNKNKNIIKKETEI